jgi:general stress protein 26
MPLELERIREILTRIPHVALATVNEDGSPLNSPVFGTFNNELHFFWASSPRTTHSQNIMRSDQVFAVVFDSREGHGGLYLSGRAEQLDDDKHVDYAYALLQKAKSKFYGKMGSLERYKGEGPQRFYRLTPEQLWTNIATRDEDGAVIYDERVPIRHEDLAL